MTETTRTVVQIRDFPGLMLERDEYDLSDGGSQNQVNVQSTDIGKLKSRQGFRVASFEDD